MICSRCYKTYDRPGQRYCHDCHAEYMRDWRTTHRLTGDALLRAKARSHAGTYKGRGVLVKKPCEECDSPDTQMHHENYSHPLSVRWLCVSCHRALHETMRHVKKVSMQTENRPKAAMRDNERCFSQMSGTRTLETFKTITGGYQNIKENRDE